MTATRSTAEHKIVVRIVNPRNTATTFVLEPWGETFEMPAHAEFVIVGRGPDGDGPEIAVDDDGVTVWGWPGSVLRVFHGEAELGSAGNQRPPAPGLARFGPTA
jgi:hypothetical protein